MNNAFEVAELDRRMGDLVKIGKIIEADYSGDIPLFKVRVGRLSTNWLPSLAIRAGGDRSSWQYEVDEQVVLLSPSGNLDQAIIIGALNQKAQASVAASADVHRTEYKDGAVIEYNRATHRLFASLPVGGKVEITAPAGFKFVGDVAVVGKLNATGEIKSDAEVSAKNIKLTKHPHSGVQSGPSNTGGPVAT